MRDEGLRHAWLERGIDVSRRIVPCLCAVLLSVSACTAGSGTAQEIRHPKAEYLPPADEVDAVVGGTSPDEETVLAVRRLVRLLRDLREIERIGLSEGEGPEVFGLVEDLAVDQAGHLYVLDSRFNQVRIFDANGHFRNQFGGSGRGPNEFLAPEAIAIDIQGRVLVADRGNQVKVFERRGTTFQYVSRIQVKFVPEDMCVLDDWIYVQGFRQENQKTVHGYRLAGGETLSFGPTYSSPNWLVRSQLSDGSIACNPDVDAVVFAFELFPYILAYGQDGHRRWLTRLEEFTVMTITQAVEPDGQPSVTLHGGVFNTIGNLLAGPGETVIVQVRGHDESSMRERREYATLRTYVLSARTGEGMYVGDRLPIIGVIAGDRVYAAQNDPFPQVVILEQGGR